MSVSRIPYPVSRIPSLVVICLLFIYGLWTVDCGLTKAAVLDSYFENFANRQDGVTIDGADSWKVSQGESLDAIIQSDITPADSDKALKLSGAQTTTIAQRSVSYGSLSPTWISFKVRPPQAAQNPGIPSKGIAALCWDYSGKVLASDGPLWIDTGKTYSAGKWYEAVMKLNFKTHRYDLYFKDAEVSGEQFVPVKTDLKFIDTSINSLSTLKFYGAYSASNADDVYIGDVSVTYIDRLEIVSASQKLMAGEPSGPVTFQLQNSLSEPQTAISDTTLELRTSSATGRFSLSRQPWLDIIQVTLPKNAQGAAFYYKDNTIGKPIISISEYPDQGFTDVSQQEEIVAGISYFDVTLPLAKAVAGSSLRIKITAKDDNGNVNEAYGGTVNLSVNYISPEGGSYSISPDRVSGFVRGSAEAEVFYSDCGLISITAADSDSPYKIGVSPQVLFIPASFEVSADRFQTVSQPFILKVSAKNILGGLTPNYKSAVSLYPVAVTPADIAGGLLSPTIILGNEFKKGAAEFSTSYNLYGTIKIRAEDSADSTRQGISNGISFSPKAISVRVKPPPAGRDFFYVGENIDIIVKVEDELGNPIPNYPGISELSSASGLNLPSDYAFSANDAGQRTFLATSVQPGTYKVVAKAEGGSLSAESAQIKVKNALIEVVDTVSPIGSSEVAIQLVDEQGRIITSENNLTVNIKVFEDTDNNSVSLHKGSVTLSGGRATIPISDTEAELVTVVPWSDYKIDIKKGTITFGQAAKGGIGILMWRELKKKK